MAARLIEFTVTVTVTDRAGRATTSRFRVLTTLLDHEAYPAQQIAALYAERWQAELVYKTIKSTLRGGDRRLRGQSPDLAEQEVWAILTVYNALVAQAVTAAVDLGIDPDEIFFTVVLHATRDHLSAAAPCRACGHRNDLADLQTPSPPRPANAPDGPGPAPEPRNNAQPNTSATDQIYP